MRKFGGETVVRGIAVGQIYILREKTEYTEKHPTVDVSKEWKRVRKAIVKTMRQLEILTEQARSYAGENAANIFEAHQMILMDDEFADSIEGILKEEQICGEMAVMKTGQKFSDMFAAMDMEYMRARAADIRDITDRIVQNMNEAEEEQIQQVKNKGPVILISETMNPSDIFRFGIDSVQGLVTTKGSATSHTAILARTMNVPAMIHVSDIDLTLLKNGTMAILDTNVGKIILNPTPDELVEAKVRTERHRKEEEELQKYIGVKSYAKDGRQIKVFANISDISEIDRLKKAGGEGVGLYRSEFLYMGRKDFPSEEEQFQYYRAMVQQMESKPLLVRTADFGSDKPLDYFTMEEEANPALGLRGIRVSLKFPELFKVQLRALFRAAVYGNLSILYPLITSTVELHNIQKVIQEAILELESQHLDYRIPAQGIMIETPVAVMIGDELAEMVDFFSIGTNDLAQYALAIDRANTDLNMMHNPQHEGIMRMIEMTIQAAHRHGTRVGICGEMVLDETLLKRFVDMGVDEVSVAAGDLLKVRKILSE